IRKAKQKFSDFEIESTPLEESTKNLIKFLERDEVKPVNDEWERTKKKYKKNPHWYSLFDGPSNLRELSKLLSLEVIYDILYTDLSGYVHASDSINQIKVTD